MASRDTGFNALDADWTRGRAQAVADAEGTARRQMALAKTVTLRAALKGESHE